MAKTLCQNSEGRQRWMSAGEMKQNPDYQPIGQSARAPKSAKVVEAAETAEAPMPQVLAKIKASQTAEEVEAAIGADTRPQVINAGAKRKSEISANKAAKVVSKPDSDEADKAAAAKAPAIKVEKPKAAVKASTKAHK